MGFSVSGAAAIIFASMFIAFGMWFTASSNSFDRIINAQDVQTEGTLETSNTDVAITTATYNSSGNGRLVVEANNTGASELSLSSTDFLIDGIYVDGWQNGAEVEGVANTDLWLSGEQLVIDLERGTEPQRVKLVTEAGVSTVATVEVIP
jgi:flagellar protein FlaF